MCQFKYTHHSCGHTLPKLEEPNDPSCKLCVPVLVALKYYHDQPMQVCIENSFQQRPIRMPRPCRPIGPESSRGPEDIAHTHAQDLTHFERIMEQLEVTVAERKYIQELALKPNQTSKRSTNMSMPLTHFSPRKIQFIMELETWQHRPYQPPNITFNTVTWGCGGTGPGVQSDCLVGWTGQGILMYRHGVWNANPLHHWDPQSPPALGFLRIDYGDAPVLQLPERWRATATRTSIDIPMSTCLYAVLRGRSPGPLVSDDQGYLVPALGASGPDIPTGLHFSPRPPQVFVSPERSRDARGRRHLAPWNPSASTTQAAGGSKPKETYKQRSNKNQNERHGHSQTIAGPSQPVNRAEIHTMINESPPTASVEATNESAEDTVLYQPPRHRTPHAPKAEAEISASEGKKPVTRGLSHSQEPIVNPPFPADDQAPEDQFLFDMSSNILIGAGEGQLPTQPPSQSPIPQIGTPQASTQTPRPSPLIRSITQSTSQMTHYAAQLNANAQQQQQQQVQVPGVEYTFNPTAEAFAPGSEGGKSGEE